MRTRRVLFFAESVTLAHVARPLALAAGLDPGSFDVFVASDERYRRFAPSARWLGLTSIDSAQFLGSLAAGKPVYDTATLRAYVRDDLALIEKVKPDLVVGDFRLSLSVSARLAGVPYAAISNAYWSPYTARKAYPMPVLPITRYLPLGVAEALFRLVRPFAFKSHCAPLNTVRREHGLPSLGTDVRTVYSDADHVLFADSERLFPTVDLPASHRYLGPIVWSPPVAQPDWWNRLPSGKPVIYLTLGSSGQASLSRLVMDALADLSVTVIASMAGAPPAGAAPANAFVADYLPGAAAAARACLVICNGGSPTSHQALAAGVPVLGIASNMDQFLNMQAIVEANAGAVMRADRVRPTTLRDEVQRLLAADAVHRSAAALAGEHQPSVAPRRFADFARAVVAQTPAGW